MSANGRAVPHVLVLEAGWQEPSWRAQPARERLRALSRRALARLAREHGLADGPWTKDGDGAPAPLSGGWRWSVSHSGGFAAAALGPVVRLGVDVEPATRVPSAAVRERLGRLGVSADDDADWLRAWCRVEAALKCFGAGLSALGQVRVEGPLVRVAGRAAVSRAFDVGGAVVAVAGGGVCAMAEPRLAPDREVAA